MLPVVSRFAIGIPEFCQVLAGSHKMGRLDTQLIGLASSSQQSLAFKWKNIEVINTLKRSSFVQGPEWHREAQTWHEFSWLSLSSPTTTSTSSTSLTPSSSTFKTPLWRLLKKAGQRFKHLFVQLQPGDALFFHSNLLHTSAQAKNHRDHHFKVGDHFLITVKNHPKMLRQKNSPGSSITYPWSFSSSSLPL